MIFQFQHGPNSSLADTCFDLRQPKMLLPEKAMPAHLTNMTDRLRVPPPPSLALYSVLGFCVQWCLHGDYQLGPGKHLVQLLGKGCSISRDYEMFHSFTSLLKTSEPQGSVLFSSYITDSIETMDKFQSNCQIK